MNESFVSIIVPVYNAQKTLKKCIESLIGIDYPKYDILLIDDGSLDNTKNILFEYKDRIQLIENEHFGPSKCRNIAAQKAKGEYLVFTDADCIVDKNWLRELLKGFINQNVVAVGGSQCSPKDETFFGKCVQEFFELTGFLGGYIKKQTTACPGNYNWQARDDRRRTTDPYLKQVSHNPSCNVMYRKDVFLEIGGLDETLWPAEDVDLDYRLKLKGFTFMYNPRAIVYHYRPQNVKELSKMMYRYGITQGILTRRYGFFRKIQMIPIVFLFLLMLFILNRNFLWFTLFFYSFLLWKTRRLAVASFVFIFSIFSFVTWIVGFIKGIWR